MGIKAVETELDKSLNTAKDVIKREVRLNNGLPVLQEVYLSKTNRGKAGIITYGEGIRVHMVERVNGESVLSEIPLQELLDSFNKQA